METGEMFGLTVKMAKPTQGHRLAISECMLGTVYGISPAGEARYFDYDYAAALAFAEATQNDDPRWARPHGGYSYIRSGCTEANPSISQKCLWVKKSA